MNRLDLIDSDRVLGRHPQHHQQSPPFTYCAYGLGIQSDLHLPEFIPAKVDHDVTIHVDYDRAPDDCVSAEMTKQSIAVKLSHGEVAVYVKDSGVFLVQNGTEIVVIPASSASEQQIREALLGKVMGILLHQRLQLVLQASAVNINGGAVLFLGKSSQGKSAMAAALQAQGWDLMTDQMAAVTLDQGVAKISSGSPTLNAPLAAAAEQTSGCDASLLPPRGQQLGDYPPENSPQLPLPIRGLYFLSTGPEQGIQPLKSHEAMIKLIHHSGLVAPLRARGTRQLLQCAALIKACPVYRLTHPRSLSVLSDMASLLACHAMQL